MLCDTELIRAVLRTCSVDFKYNSTVCDNLDDYPDVQDVVQKKVSDYQAYGTYLDLISTFAALYIGNVVDYDEFS